MAQLTAAKRALEIEVNTRAGAENALLRERATLERRVLQRTEELALRLPPPKPPMPPPRKPTA